MTGLSSRQFTPLRTTSEHLCPHRPPLLTHLNKYLKLISQKVDVITYLLGKTV